MRSEEIIDSLLDQVAALKAERDALKADAERYRWLRKADRETLNDAAGLAHEYANAMLKPREVKL